MDHAWSVGLVQWYGFLYMIDLTLSSETSIGSMILQHRPTDWALQCHKSCLLLLNLTAPAFLEELSPKFLASSSGPIRAPSATITELDFTIRSARCDAIPATDTFKSNGLFDFFLIICSTVNNICPKNNCNCSTSSNYLKIQDWFLKNIYIYIPLKELWYQIDIIRLMVKYIFIICLFRVIVVDTFFFYSLCPDLQGIKVCFKPNYTTFHQFYR